MRPGVSYPHFRAGAAFAMITGSDDTDYPVSNLGDLKAIRRVFRASGSGAVAFSFVLAADQMVQFLALIHHNGLDGETYRIRLYDDTGLTSEVHDSGTLILDIDPASLFPNVTPYLLDEAITVRSGRIDLSDIGVAWEMGGLEVSGFWDLTELTSLSRGFKSGDFSQDAGEGVFHRTRQFAPRMASLGLDVVEAAADGVTLLDFQMEKGLSEPFVWTRDVSDPSTWGREAVLVRNTSLAPLGKDEWIYAHLGLNTQEHLR